VHAPLPPYRVQLIDEHDTWCVSFRLLEQIADSRRSNPDKHLHEFTSANGKEGHLGLARHCAGQQRFAGSGRTYKQHAFGDLRTQGTVALWMHEECHHFLQLVLGFLAARDIIESDFCVLVGHQFCAARSDTHHRLAEPFHAARKELPQQNHDSDRQNPIP
jgi:hypothetical protein